MNLQSENERIASLPVYTAPDRKFVADTTARYCVPNAPFNPDGSPFELRMDQAFLGWSYETFGGGLGAIDVGGGKTLASFLIANIGIMSRGHKRVLIIIPPRLAGSTVKTELPWIRQRISLRYNVFVLCGKNRKQREKIASTGAPGVYLMSYSQLSQLDSVDILRAISPTLWIPDEAHRLADEKSAASKRFWNISQANPDVEYVFLSGTMFRRELFALARMASSALREHSPLPRMVVGMEEWNQWIGLGSESLEIGSTMTWLCDWAAKTWPDEADQFPHNVVGLRRAFNRRVRSAPGMVFSTEQPCTAQILCDGGTVPEPANDSTFEHTKELIERALLGEDPMGEALPTPMNCWNVANELTNGFFNYRYWPEPSLVAAQRGVSVDQAAEWIARSQAWLSAANFFRSECFAYTSVSDLGSDTEMQVRNKILEGETAGMPGTLVASYWQMRQLDFPERVERLRAHHWVSRWKLHHIVRQAQEAVEWSANGGCLVWAYHKAMQLGIYEELSKTGMDPIIAGGDYAQNIPYLEDPALANRVFVASQKSCGEGLRLQHHDAMVFGQCVRQGSTLQQMLGRTHRLGQTRPRVKNWMAAATEFEQQTLASALLESAGLHSASGAQKAIQASWSPAPSFVPAEMLYLRVPNLARQDPTSVAEYLRKFSDDGLTASSDSPSLREASLQ